MLGLRPRMMSKIWCPIANGIEAWFIIKTWMFEMFQKLIFCLKKKPTKMLVPFPFSCDTSSPNCRNTGAEWADGDVDDSDSDDGADGDFDIDDIEEERRSCVLNTYFQMDTKGSVGSVHTPHCYLRVSEGQGISGDHHFDFDASGFAKTKRQVSSSRKNMKICGGQGYHPVLKSMTLCEQRQHMETLAHLPLLVQRILTSARGSYRSH